jgi:hypothetical protein
MDKREERILALFFDLKVTIDDLIHELKGLVNDVDRLKQRTGLK